MKLVILKGWATTDLLYKNIFKSIKNIKIYDYFELDEKSEIFKEDDIVFLGWSLGSIRLLEISKNIRINKAILISPTFNFLEDRNDKKIKNLKNNIIINKEKALKEFFLINFKNRRNYKKYIDLFLRDIISKQDDILLNGLNYLEKTFLNKKENFNINKCLVISAIDDLVINNKRSEEVSSKLKNSNHIIYNKCGHNILFEKEDEILKEIRGFL